MNCESCGAVSAVGSRFCADCGSPLGGVLQSAAPGPSSTPARTLIRPGSGELRWASVLFVDLVNYTALTHSWDAADVRDMLSTYFDEGRRIIARYGGEVAKFIGDAIVAVWGSRLTREDDSERCVGAGLEIVQAVGTLQGESWQLSARAGVVTGRVALLGGAQEGLVAGDIVNMASRIQSAAAPGTVLVDDVTMRASRSVLAYASGGEHQFKGFPEPVQVWRALRVVGRGQAAQLGTTLRTSFVGRDGELTALEQQFRAMLDARTAKLAVVTGGAGIGKSRLVAEFETNAGQVTGIAWHRGRCPSYGDGVAFHALSQVIHQVLRLDDDDPSGTSVALLHGRLARWMPDEEERDFVAPRLAVLVGHSGRDFSRQELFAAWRLFLERLADAQPVVLMVEDLQWADSGLVKFLEYLLDWSATKPLLLLTLARAESDNDSIGLANHGSAGRVHLQSLSPRVIEQILDGLVPGMPPGLRQKIISQAAGVPLYAVETVGALIDRGLIAERDGHLAVVGDVEDLEVPASLTALIAERLDQLPTSEREFVKALAILGSSFSRHEVAAAVRAPDDEIEPQLRVLVSKGVLAVADGPADGTETYGFVQSLLGTVAVELLSRRERKARHLAVASHVEQSRHDARDAELVAAHYLDAYRASATDGDRDEIRARTAAAYERAAARVGSLGSPERASGYYNVAATLTANEVDRLRLITSAARETYLIGRYEESLRLYEEAVEGHRAAGRDLEVARLAAPIGRALSVLGRSTEGFTILTEAIKVLAQHRQVAAEAEAHSVLAEWYAFSLEEQDVVDHADRALDLASAAGSPEILCKALNAKGWLLQRQHRFHEAADTFERLVEVARDNDIPKAQLMGRGNLADVRSQADLPGAEAEHLAALELADRLGDVGNRAIALGNVALHYFYAGQWDRTMSYGQRGVESASIPDLENFGHFPLLILAIAQGHARTARAHLQQLHSWKADDDAQSRDSYLIAQAAVASLDGSPSEFATLSVEAARSSYEDNGLVSESFRLALPLALEAMIKTADPDGGKRLIAMLAEAPASEVPPYLAAQRARCSALLTLISRPKATDIEPDLRFAVETFAALGYPYWQARAQGDLGRWLLTQHRQEEADPLLDQARSTFIRLGATPDLSRG